MPISYIKNRQLRDVLLNHLLSIVKERMAFKDHRELLVHPDHPDRQVLQMSLQPLELFTQDGPELPVSRRANYSTVVSLDEE